MFNYFGKMKQVALEKHLKRTGKEPVDYWQCSGYLWKL